MDNEYTDYSCSTSMERLARDVETVLAAKWHVDVGSDRHVAQSTTGFKKLRSERILWNVSFHTETTRVQCDLELVLALWNGPEPESNVNTSNLNDSLVSYAMDEPMLPYSIRRRPIRMAWSNFSDLFGIGQHITLTPVHAASFCQDTPLNPSYKLLMDYISRSVLKRHDIGVAGGVASATLSTWLQQALNLAVVNVNCQLPVFGLWSTYPAPSTGSLDVVPAWWRPVILSPDVVQAWKRHQRIIIRPHHVPAHANANRVPPLLQGLCSAPHTQSTFWVCWLPDSIRHWTTYAHLLEEESGDLSHLLVASHTFCWAKQHHSRSVLWRALGMQGDPSYWRPSLGEVPALERMAQAVGSSDDVEPMWGTTHDPVAKCTLRLSWHNEGEPVLTLPLTDRERFSTADYDEFLSATEATVLDITQPAQAHFAAYYTTPAGACLAATQRCVLAAWTVTAANHNPRHVAVLSKQAHLDETTISLLSALVTTNDVDTDETSSHEDVMDEYLVQDIVRKLFSVSNDAEQPVPFFPRAAPPGHFVSLMAWHMAHVRTPTNMMAVYNAVCGEWRCRAESRVRIPGIPGSPQHSRQAISHKQQAANLFGEADPDFGYTVMGQKLQVLNVAMEQLVWLEQRPVPMANQEDLIDDMPHTMTLKNTASTSNESIEAESNCSQEEFFDANDDGFLAEATNHRKGARCPVAGASLMSSGDQVYAPYLQRPVPLTDDMIAERKMVFARQSNHKASTAIQQRLEIAQRFQRPKLLSDMQSFKAANPGASFLDFVAWYGNPTDPLAEFQMLDLSDTQSTASADDSQAVKIDKAAEAIKALEQTRDFWTHTWEAAKRIPAAEQDPLFDAESTIEMALDYLENIHPATLLGQVMAVNLSNAYYILSTSAGDTTNILPVSVALTRLREKVDSALKLLAANTMRQILPIDSEVLVSVPAIASCARACEALAAAEVIVARAASLLHKLPQQYQLVETILKLPEGAQLEVTKEHAGRNAFLNTIWEQQRTVSSKTQAIKPSVCEYLLRNCDDAAPSQLSIRQSDEGIRVCGEETLQTVLSLSKSMRDGDVV